MEVIGTYDPIPKEPREGESNKWKDIRLDISRAKYWLGVGAQPSDPAWRLLAMVRRIFVETFVFFFLLSLGARAKRYLHSWKSMAV